MNAKMIVAAAAAVATLSAAALPAAGVAAGAPTKTVAYTVKVKSTAVVGDAASIRATAVVTNPESSVTDWWSRAAVSSVVRKAVNEGLEVPYGSQGYRCVPSIQQGKKVTNARFTCKLQGADVPTSIKLTFTVPFQPPTGP